MLRKKSISIFASAYRRLCVRLDSIELALDTLRSEHNRLQRHAHLLEDRLEQLEGRSRPATRPAVKEPAEPRLPRFAAFRNLEDAEDMYDGDGPQIVQQNTGLFWWAALALALLAGAATFVLVRPQVLFQL